MNLFMVNIKKYIKLILLFFYLCWSINILYIIYLQNT